MDEFRALLAARIQRRGELARLSERSGLAGQVLTRWKDGTSRPSPENLQRLAPAVDVPYESLLRMCGYLPPLDAEPVRPQADDAYDEIIALVRSVPREDLAELKPVLRRYAVPPLSHPRHPIRNRTQLARTPSDSNDSPSASAPYISQDGAVSGGVVGFRRRRQAGALAA